MQIIYRTGDVIAGDEAVIIHGCNAQGEMGSGVAEAVRQRLPFAYDAYREVYLQGIRDARIFPLPLGSVIWAIDIHPERRPRIVGNAITQWTYGREPGRRYVNYEAIRDAIREVDRFIQTPITTLDGRSITGQSVGMPMIGAGLGGGVWAEIAPIIEEESKRFQPVVYSLPQRNG